MPKISFCYTLKSWQFGVGLDFSSVSQVPVFGFYAIMHPEISFYFGPFTLDITFGEHHYVDVVYNANE